MPYGAPLAGYRLAKTLELVESKGGAIFYDRIRTAA